MVIDLSFVIIIEPLLWSLFVFFGLMTIVNAINRVASKTKQYAIIYVKSTEPKRLGVKRVIRSMAYQPNLINVYYQVCR